MTNPVGTKARKKQPSISPPAPISQDDKALEQALLALEDACQRLLDDDVGAGGVGDARYWQLRLKNIVTPISLALVECKGPRQFHYHYRHREDDDSVLQPVMESPIDTLASVCEKALDQAERQLVGIQDTHLLSYSNILQRSLRQFLHSYDDYQEQVTG